MKSLASTTKYRVDVMATVWTHIFFGKNSECCGSSTESLKEEAGQEIIADLNDNDLDVNTAEEEDDNNNEDHRALVAADIEEDAVSRKITGSLLKNIKVLTIQEKKLVDVIGPDAVQYLRFQKYIIIYILFTSVVSCIFILPLNFTGTQLGLDSSDFGHTTLANLSPSQDGIILWIHVVIAFLMFPVAIFLMRRFSIGLKMTDTSLKITRTLAIENIPENLCRIENLKQHFSEAYGNFPIYDIQVVYNVTKLMKLSFNLENVVDSLEFCSKSRHNQDLEMIPVTGARCCGCCCFPCVDRVKCIEYFEKEKVRLQGKIAEERIKCKEETLGMAFVTFENINDARKVLRDHKKSILNFKAKYETSSLAMEPGKWRVWFAPPPGDIIWENLSNRRWTIMKKIIANIFIFMLAFFLTTPQYFVHQLEPFLWYLKTSARNFSEADTNITNNGTSRPIMEHIKYLPVFLTDFLPTLMLWTFTALLPSVISWTDRLVGHWTRSGLNNAIMKKTYWYLLFMVIIFPTFGFTSTQAFFEFLFETNSSQHLSRWECIFLPDSGAFFVNYVITAAMIGSGLELIMFPLLFWYLIQICISRSKADTPAIRKAIKYEFRFGEQYARMMLIFAMVVMFSISCPLITPFGLLYFILKHLVDRHNLAFVYARTKIDKKVHVLAINFVIISVALLQLFMVIFSFIRSLDSDWSLDEYLRTTVSLGLFIISLNVCSAQIWSNTCRKISPIKYEDVMLWEDEENCHVNIYLPPQ